MLKRYAVTSTVLTTLFVLLLAACRNQPFIPDIAAVNTPGPTNTPKPTPTVLPLQPGDQVRVSCAQGILSYLPANPISSLLCVGYTPTVTPVPPPTLTSVASATVAAATATNTPSAIGGPIVAAFHYPWFPGSWTQGGTFPYTQYHPSLGYYNSSDDALISQQLALARSAHLQAFITSWWGPQTLTDQAIQHIIPYANTIDPTFQWAIYYEAEGQINPTTTQIQADLSYLTPLFANPNYLRINQKPVVFVYADGSDASGMAVRWAPLNPTYYVVLKVYPGYKTDPNQPGGWHQYAPAVAVDSQLPYSVAVSPGFFKSGEASPRLVRNPTTFDTNITNMVASRPTFELITTWNEWGEGSSVEPASEFNTTYIDIMCRRIPGPKPCSQTTPTPTPQIATPTPMMSATPTLLTVATPSQTPSRAVTATATVGASTPTRTPAPPTVTRTRTPTPLATNTPGAVGTVPPLTHVWILAMENKEYSSVIGNVAAPYQNQLARDFGTNTNYFSLNHPSEPTYVLWSAGSTMGVTDDGVHNLSGDNLFDQLEAAGLDWREYDEHNPGNCYLGATYSGGPDGSGTGARKHTMAINWLQIQQTPARCAKIANFSSYTNNGIFTFIQPDLNHDCHDQGEAFCDSWLASWLPSHILNTPEFQAGGVLFLVYDEGSTSLNGGGKVMSLVISPLVKSGTVSNILHNHLSLIRTIQDGLGLPCLRGTCNATPMSEFFAS